MAHSARAHIRQIARYDAAFLTYRVAALRHPLPTFCVLCPGNLPWAEAVRQHVLDDELRRLPAAFQQLAATVEDYMAQTNRILAELPAGQVQLQAKFLPFDARKMIGVIAGRLNIRRPAWLDNTDLLDIAYGPAIWPMPFPKTRCRAFTPLTWPCGRWARRRGIRSMWSLNAPITWTGMTSCGSGAMRTCWRALPAAALTLWSLANRLPGDAALVAEVRVLFGCFRRRVVAARGSDSGLRRDGVRVKVFDWKRGRRILDFGRSLAV